MTGPSTYFLGNARGLTGKAHRARASDGSATLVFDGMVYGLKGQSDFPAGLSVEEIAGRCLKAYRADPQSFFERVSAQGTIGVEERGELHFYRTPLSASQLYFTDEAIGNRLLPVYLAAERPAADPAYFWALLLERASLHYESPRTPFKTIRRLAPGTAVTIGRAENGARRARVRPIDASQRFPYPARPGQEVEEVAAKVRRLLEGAVEARLPAPSAPVVCHLSGGLDSSFVAALVARRRPDLTSFMYSFPDRPSHAMSLACARTVSRELGIPLTVVEPREIPRTDLGARLAYCDEPNTAFWQGALFAPITDRLVPSGGALLTGFGADQIFQSDPRILPWLLQRGELRLFTRLLGDAARRFERSRAHLFWQSLLLSLPHGLYRRLSTPFAQWRFNPFALEEMEPDAVLYEKVDWLEVPEQRHLAELLGLGEAARAPGCSKLEFSYLVAPALSGEPYLEARGARSEHPYCDRRLIEYVLGEVSWHLVHDWKRPYKYLLREAQRGTVPETVRNRGKNEFYFDGFLARLLRDNQTVLRDLLSDPELPVPLTLCSKALHRALDELSFGVLSNSASKLLVLIAYLIWWRDFREAAAAATPGKLRIELEPR